MILDFARDEAEEVGRGVLVAAAAEEGVPEGGGGAGAVAVETTVATAGALDDGLNLQKVVSYRTLLERGETYVAVTNTAEAVTVDVVGSTEATLAIGTAVTEATALGM